MRNKLIIKIFTLFLFLAAGFVTFFAYLSGSPEPDSLQEEVFIVGKNTSGTDVIRNLYEKGYIKNPAVFNLIRNYSFPDHISPGGYNLSKSWNAVKIASKMTSGKPDLVWFTIPEGWRREQIGDGLSELLGWTNRQLDEWTNLATTARSEYVEGVYFPDTYLIPFTDSPGIIAGRFLNHFDEKFKGFPEKFAAKNTLWTTGLKVASLIQRETADPSQMPMISGIIWNRLEKGMRLQIDATLQYAKGKSGNSWWGTVLPQDKDIDSPYNTYLHKGLPPTPICNPGTDAINAALNPASTDCLYYLHDHTGQMYCSATYEEHLKNIDLYLKK